MLLASLALALLSVGHSAGTADASVSDYPATLYLSGAASTRLGTSNTLVATAGPGAPTTPPTAAVAGAGALVPSSYTYEYTVVNATGGETPPSPTVAVTVSGSNQMVNVGVLPTGVTVRLYRKGSSGIFRRVAEYVNNGSATQTDNMSDATANSQALLPLSQTKQMAFATGFYEFAPGGTFATTAATSSSVASPAFSGKGWLVDAAGRVSIPSGTWTFTNNIKGTAGSGTARLVIGMWKVNDSGAVVGSPIIDPAGAGENTVANIATVAGTASAIVTTFNGVGAISLAAGEHLYVQFWRHQTTASSSTITTLYVYDGGVTKIAHPAANGFPDVPVLGGIAARVNTTPTLSTTFTDPDADTGTISFQLCSDSPCGTVLQSFTSASLASGANATWTPAALADGAYYWRASATDSAGNLSGFSATSSFVVDTVAPTTPSLVSPAAAVRVNSTQVSATFADADAGDTGTVSFQLCSNSSCSSVVASGTSATVSGGSAGSWTPTGIADGAYYWRAQNTDTAGNASAWSATRGFTLDTTAPGVPALVAVGALLKAVPQLSAGFSDPDGPDTGTISFQVCTDSGCASVVQAGTSPGGVANGSNGSWTPPTLVDGSYFWRARALDAAGNQSSAWSGVQQFSLDTTAPSTPTLGAIAARTNVTPQLTATCADPDAPDTGTVSFQLCSNSSCSSVLQSATSAAGIANGASANWTPTPLASAAAPASVRQRPSNANGCED